MNLVSVTVSFFSSLSAALSFSCFTLDEASKRSSYLSRPMFRAHEAYWYVFLLYHHHRKLMRNFPTLLIMSHALFRVTGQLHGDDSDIGPSNTIVLQDNETS